MENDEARVHLAEAQQALARDDLEGARFWAELALGADPQCAEAHLVAGTVAERQHLVGTAGDHFLAAAQIDPAGSQGLDRLRCMRRRHRVLTAATVVIVFGGLIARAAFYVNQSDEDFPWGAVLIGTCIGILMIPYLIYKIAGTVPRNLAELREIRAGFEPMARATKLSPEARQALRRSSDRTP